MRQVCPKVSSGVSPIKITEQSLKSLFIEMFYNDTLLAVGTGFVVFAQRGPVLVTNRHNVTGRDQNSGQPLDSRNGGVPNRLVIHHHVLGATGRVAPTSESLYADGDPHGGQPLWIEHPRLGSRADFVALPLTDTSGRQMFAYRPASPGHAIHVGIADPVSVVGFPFGVRSGGTLPVWATGFVATEPDIDHDDLPQILIDCRTRRGQSGSAVIAYRSGGGVAMERGGSATFSGPVSKFIGIYSGRINPESDLGIVWKASAIAELIAAVG